VTQERFLDINIRMNEFEKLGLSQEVLKVLKEEGFEKPTEIQEKTIPLLLKGKDLVGGSVTGSGKTLAFSAPIIENLIPHKKIQALILTPTRELAEQVSESIKKFSRNKNLNILAIYGGVSIEPQMRKLAIADVVVGTPGRILDHMQKRTLRLDNVKFLVLDEVDRMFDMGFRNDVEKIIRNCPKQRQTMLFSATISNDIDYLAKRYTRNPERISVRSYLDASKLKQIYYDVENDQKFSLLVHLLKKENADLVMVFCNTRRNADFVVSNLTRTGISAKAIHGGLDQKKRIRVLQDFHGKGVSVLVCTDVAARGLDIKGVSHIYNYDLPSSNIDYIHRIGRTARAGKEGIVINLLSSRDYENFGNITRDSSLKIINEELPRFERVRITNEFGRKRFNSRSGFGGQRDRGRNDGRSRGFGGDFRNKGRRDGNKGNFRGPRKPDRGDRWGKDNSKRNFGESFGNKGKREGNRSFGNKRYSGGDSKRNFGRIPQRHDRKRPNTRRSGNMDRGRR